MPKNRATSSAPPRLGRVTPRDVAIWLAALSPLAFVPGGFARFVFATVVIVALSGVAASMAPAHGKFPRGLASTIAAFVAVFAIACLASATPMASLVGRWPRYEGLPMVVLYAGCLWIGARVVGAASGEARDLVKACGVGALVLGAFSLLDLAGVSPLGEVDVERSGSLLGNATDQGLVAMMYAAVLFRPALERRTPFLLAAVVAATATVFVSGSRAALAVLFLAAAAQLLARSNTRRTLLQVGGVGAALVAVAFAVPVTRDRLLSSTTVRGRWLQWDTSLPILGDHPVLGIGPSRYLDVFGRYETAEWIEWVGARTTPDSPHSLVLQVFLAGGLPLLAVAVAVIVLWLRAARTAVRSSPALIGAATAAVAYGVAMMVNFTAAGSTCLALVLAGAAVAQPIPTPRRVKGKAGKAKAPPPEPRWIRTAAAGAWGLAAVLALTASVGEVAMGRAVPEALQGDTAAAETRFDLATKLRPWDPDLHMLAAQALALPADHGSVPAADATIEHADASLEWTPGTYQSLVAAGVAHNSLGDWRTGETRLTAAIAASPFRPQAHVQRAIARSNLGDVAGARADLERALQIRPDDDRVRQLLAQLQPTEE